MRRGGEAVADLIDDDDEILVGIERTATSRVHLLHDFARAGIPSGNEDSVVFCRIERAERGVGELAISNGATFFQSELAEVVELVRAVYILRVVVVVDHVVDSD